MCVMAAAVIGAVGSLVSGIQGMQAASYNAEVAKQEGARIRQMGVIQEAADRRQTDIALGQQRVDIAAAGRSMGTGTPLQLAHDSAMEAELSALATRAGFQMRAENKNAEAGLYKFQGRQALIGSAFSAAGAILNGRPGIPALG